MTRVLLVGARTPVALDVARQLHRAGVEVIGADCFPINVCRASHAVGHTVVVPSPRLAPGDFHAALQEIVRRESIDVVVPVGEEIFAVADGRDGLRALGVRLEVPTRAALDEMHDKGRFIERVRALAIDGVRAPETWAFDATAPPPARDIVLKARRSRFGSAIHLVRKGTAPPAVREPSGWIAQERIDGDEVCTLGFAREGRLLAHVAYRPVLRVERGPSYCFQALPKGARVDQLHAFTRRVVEALGWDGPIAFDAIFEASGALVPIECNPRLTSGVHMLQRLGSVLVGGEARVGPDDDRPCMHALVMLTVGLAQLRSLSAVSTWWRLFRQSREVVWERGDWLPFPAQLATFPQVLKVARTHHIPIRDATTWLIQSPHHDPPPARAQ